MNFVYLCLFVKREVREGKVYVAEAGNGYKHHYH